MNNSPKPIVAQMTYQRMAEERERERPVNAKDKSGSERLSTGPLERGRPWRGRLGRRWQKERQLRGGRDKLGRRRSGSERLVHHEPANGKLDKGRRGRLVNAPPVIARRAQDHRRRVPQAGETGAEADARGVPSRPVRPVCERET